MSGWEILGVILVAIGLGLLIMNAKDICRYLKISNM